MIQRTINDVVVNIFDTADALYAHQDTIGATRGQLSVTRPQHGTKIRIICPRPCDGCPASKTTTPDAALHSSCEDRLTPKLLKTLSTIYRRS